PVPPFPPAKESVKDMLKTDRDAAEKALKQTKIEEGQFSSVISSESSKINLNFLKVDPKDLGGRVDFSCRDAQNKLYIYIGCTLVNLMNGFLKESEDPTLEWGNLKPEEVVLDIMDWINPG